MSNMVTVNQKRIENLGFQNNKIKNQTKFKLFILMCYELLNLIGIRFEFLT